MGYLLRYPLLMSNGPFLHQSLPYPEVAQAVVQSLASALRHLVALVENLSLRHVTARVAKILLDPEASSQEDQHVYHLTQQEMAALAARVRWCGERSKSLRQQAPSRCARAVPWY